MPYCVNMMADFEYEDITVKRLFKILLRNVFWIIPAYKNTFDKDMGPDSGMQVSFIFSLGVTGLLTPVISFLLFSSAMSKPVIMTTVISLSLVLLGIGWILYKQWEKDWSQRIG